MTTDQYRGGAARHWTVRLRLAIEAGSDDAARGINAEVLRKMGVVGAAEPELRHTGRARPYWNVITDLDLSGLTTITPDDAPTRFKFVIRKLPVAWMSCPGQVDRSRGKWQWLPDSWEQAMSDEEFPHPAVRAAGIFISADS